MKDGQENMAKRLAYHSREAAAQLGISERKLWELQNRGLITPVRFGRALRYPHAELERFIEEEVRKAKRNV